MLYGKPFLYALAVFAKVAVLLACTPFEIVHRIVLWVLVQVVYLWQVARIRYESEGNKAVNREMSLFAILAESNADIAIVCKFSLYHSWFGARHNCMVACVLCDRAHISFV